MTNTYQVFLQDVKNRVPSENATPGTVRAWFLQLLRNRKVEFTDGPNAFASPWSGAELHTLHPNHMFGHLTSHGVDPQTAHMVVGDIMECLRDYRVRRAACVAAGQKWTPDARQEQAEVDVERQPLLEGSQPPSPPASTITTNAAILIGSGISIIAGLGLMAWGVMRATAEKDSSNERE